MADRASRWRLSQAVRQAMASAKEDSLLRRTHRVFRNIPGVRQVWRLIDRNSHLGWLETSRYAARGGVFGPSAAPAARKFAVPVDFDSDGFFPSLLDRIAACEPRTSTANDVVVLVNNGLSAGGAERQIVATMAGLRARGQPAIFIGEKLNGIPGQDFHLASALAAGIDARQLPCTIAPGLAVYEQVSRPVAEQLVRMPPEMLLEILELVRVLKEVRPRALHLWQDETSIKHAISGLIAGVPRIVLSSRNVNPTRFSYHRPYMRPGYRALRNAPGILFSNNSHAGTRSYAEWLGFDHAIYRVVHNGFDSSRLEPASDATRRDIRASLRIAPDAPLVLGVFRLSHEKQPLLWIDVAAEALKIVPEARFVIAGDGPMRRAMADRLKELGVGSAVQLLGARQDIVRVYTAADAFLLTSESEGLPNVLLEAQWFGLPVLVTGAGGSEEAIAPGVTGRITSATTAQGISADLSALLRDAPLRQRAFAEGPAFVQRAFGLDRMIDETLQLYVIP